MSVFVFIVSAVSKIKLKGILHCIDYNCINDEVTLWLHPNVCLFQKKNESWLRHLFVYVVIYSQPLYNLFLFFVDQDSPDITHLYQFVPSVINNHNELINDYKANFATVLTPFSDIEKTEELGEGVWFCI